MSKGLLYLIPTELSLSTGKQELGARVKEVITSLDLFFVENVRTARRFISALSLGIDISKLEFLLLDKRSQPSEILVFLEKLENGRHAGIMSEAGCPGIADPGSGLVRVAHQRNISVVPLSGPSSFTMALMASGMNGQHFSFHGYLPIDKAARINALQGLERTSKKTSEAKIFMETPYRNNQLLDDLLTTCNSTTLLCIASDLTGPEETVQTKSLKQWKAKKPNLHKIPTVFILQS